VISVFLINSLVVGIAVMIHYEFLFQMTRFLPKLPIKHRFIIVIGVVSSLLAHTAKIWVFGLAYYLMNETGGWGYFEGNFTGTLFDCVYFSFTTFTTLGFGDISPRGSIRYLTGIESLTGLVLITWTASFLYHEMRQYWHLD
jgi:hypothetical protein